MKKIIGLAVNRPAVPFVSTFEVNIAGKIGSMNARKACHLLANIN